MRESGIGRVLVVSLHQAIADVIPARLHFYEGWLSNSGLRAGTIELAPFYAVLSFLRQEESVYGVVTARAGKYAAEWTVDSMSPRRRSLIRATPRLVRTRLLVRAARQLVRESYQPSHCSATVGRGTARIEIVGSVFCSVRSPAAFPLCGFYSSALSRLSELFELPYAADVVMCRGAGQASCIVQLVPVQTASSLENEAGPA